MRQCHYRIKRQVCMENKTAEASNRGFRCYSYRAIDGTRTRDFHLGTVALSQLSHYRKNVPSNKDKMYSTIRLRYCQPQFFILFSLAILGV